MINKLNFRVANIQQEIPPCQEFWLFFFRLRDLKNYRITELHDYKGCNCVIGVIVIGWERSF